MNKSEQINELAKALSIAQSQMKPAHKDSTNPFFKSKYADFSAIWEACREPLTKNGLSIVQSTRVTENGNAILVTLLLHSSGQWISGEFPIRTMKDDPQALGSAISYGKRYSLAAMVCVATEDDDSEAAMNRPTQPVQYQRAAQTKAPSFGAKS